MRTSSIRDFGNSEFLPFAVLAFGILFFWILAIISTYSGFWLLGFLAFLWCSGFWILAVRDFYPEAICLFGILASRIIGSLAFGFLFFRDFGYSWVWPIWDFDFLYSIDFCIGQILHQSLLYTNFKLYWIIQNQNYTTLEGLVFIRFGQLTN